MESVIFPRHLYPEDVVIVHLENKSILLVGTAHISRQSSDLVELVISREQPDAVCIELDEKRFAALSQRTSWENLSLKQVIKKRQLTTLMVNLILGAYQKKLGAQLGVMPGAELLMAAETAQRCGVPVALCDRDIRITLRRAWQATSLWKKGSLMLNLLASLFDAPQLDENQLTRMRDKDVLSQLIEQLGTVLPQTKVVLIDERDIYMAEKIKQTMGRRLVAVVGTGHVAGISHALPTDNRQQLVAPVRGLAHGGIPTAIGAVLALGHPATIAASPVTSLSPLIGAGSVCAFIQTKNRSPVVRELEQADGDITTIAGWWRNKLLRIFLFFVLTTTGSALGTWLGGYRLLSTPAQ